MEISEAQLKSAVSDYLEIGQAQGKWIYLRLNSGDFIEVRGNTRRRIKGCPKGTSDFIVLYSGKPENLEYANDNPRAIFLELKSAKGRGSPEQVAFGKLVKMQGAEYRVIRSIEEIAEILV